MPKRRSFTFRILDEENEKKFESLLDQSDGKSENDRFNQWLDTLFHEKEDRTRVSEESEDDEETRQCKFRSESLDDEDQIYCDNSQKGPKRQLPKLAS